MYTFEQVKPFLLVVWYPQYHLRMQNDEELNQFIGEFCEEYDCDESEVYVVINANLDVIAYAYVKIRKGKLYIDQKTSNIINKDEFSVDVSVDFYLKNSKYFICSNEQMAQFIRDSHTHNIDSLDLYGLSDYYEFEYIRWTPDNAI